MTEKGPESVRQEVRTAYSEAISRSNTAPCSAGCCWSPSAANAPRVGYTKEDLAAVPVQAASSSFGCGNPLAFAGVEQGQTVVDLGSGAGLDLLLAARAVGPSGRVIGIDMTETMIEAARANIERSRVTNVEVRKGIIESMPVDDEAADWVVSNCVINLSPEKAKVFAEIFRVLKPGGTMLVSDVVVQDLPRWARDRSDLLTACIAGAVSEEEYLRGLRDAGLVDVRVTERVELGADLVRPFLESEELPIASSGDAAAAAAGTDGVVETLAGKVWSARISASKPVAAPPRKSRNHRG